MIFKVFGYCARFHRSKKKKADVLTACPYSNKRFLAYEATNNTCCVCHKTRVLLNCHHLVNQFDDLVVCAPV